MFHDWDNFYLLVGSGAGALIGLMFVVVTLTAELNSTRLLKQGAQVYVTPIVFHFAVIVIVSAISAVPEMPAAIAGWLLALCAAVGFAYATLTTVRMFLSGWESPPDWEDKIYYGILPSIIYVCFGVAVGAVWLAPEWAAYGVGATMLVLLLSGIRNAWDLATFIVQRTVESRAKD